MLRTFYLQSLFLLFLVSPGIHSQDKTLTEPVKFLALGDSYTIGESVEESERWPVQLQNSLVEMGYETEELKIIARTGWRTDDLERAIEADNPSEDYNLVSLLIGVNDQYQGRNTEWYRPRFTSLLGTAIELAGGNKNAVFVVSIPDYAYTPFGQRANPSRITSEIDEFNEINRLVSDSMGIRYFNITPISREGLAKTHYVADDGLHPSGEMYAEWVKLILHGLLSEDISTSTVPVSRVHGGIKVWYSQASDSLIMEFPGDSDSSQDLLVCDAGGKVVFRKNSKAGSVSSDDSYHEIVIPGLDPGIYFYRLVDSGGIVQSGKFLKM